MLIHNFYLFILF